MYHTGKPKILVKIPLVRKYHLQKNYKKIGKQIPY